MVSEHAMRKRTQHCLHSVSPYIKRIKFEKLSVPDIAFSKTLHEKYTQSTFKKVQSRINPKSTEKRAEIR